MHEWDDDHLDDEGPLSVDLEELGDKAASETLPCPVCGREIYEHADQCPHCGQYIVPRIADRPGVPWLWLLAALAVILIVLSLVTC